MWRLQLGQRPCLQQLAQWPHLGRNCSVLMTGWPRAATALGGSAAPLVSPLLLDLAISAFSGHTALGDCPDLFQHLHLQELVAVNLFAPAFFTT